MNGQASRVMIIGAGMSGPLMAIYLARRGFAVDVYERRPECGREPLETGKSVRLTLAERGLHALGEVGLAEEVLATCCIPLYGRAVHAGNGAVASIPYGKNQREVIYSFSRADLNALLLRHAAAYENIELHFSQRCLEIDKATATALFRDERTGAHNRVQGRAIIGADGAFSRVRQDMQRGERADYRQEFLPWGYKELSIAAAADGSHQMEKHALHIWPCGHHMLFALPSLDGSFNAVCVLPFDGDHCFSSLRTEGDLIALFRRYFADALPLMPRLCEEFASRKTAKFVTIYTSQWYYRDKVVLIGDASHAVVPFYGQGMNAAFEDCSVLDGCIAAHAGDWEAAFRTFQQSRKPHTDVLADLSVENFHELCDTVRRPIVAARKRTAIFLNRLLSDSAVPIYTLISHTNVPYAECVEQSKRQDRIARWLGLDLVVGAVSLWIYLRNAWARWRSTRGRQPLPAPAGLPDADPSWDRTLASEPEI